jgi:hypothetical protein
MAMRYQFSGSMLLVFDRMRTPCATLVLSNLSWDSTKLVQVTIAPPVTFITS